MANRTSVAPKAGPVGAAVEQVGDMFAFSWCTAVSALRGLRHGRFAWRECLDQTWFLAKVTTVPAVLVMIPFGIAVALNVGSLAAQIGAEAYGGAIVAFLIVGQAAPLVCALMIAGVGGSAMCADLGSRTIREETDAMSVMGLSVVERLVVPRVAAAVVVTLALNAIVMVIGIGATLGFHTLVMDGTPGSFLATLTQFARPGDFFIAELKAGMFAVLSAVVACYKGLTVRGGPQGVGDAVNETVVLAFILVFIANVALSQLYALFVPGPGEF